MSGTLAPTLRVEPGYEVAIGAALGAAVDAALAEGADCRPQAALDELLRDDIDPRGACRRLQQQSDSNT